MEKPIEVTKYNKKVFETPIMDNMRNEHCMCLNCSKLIPVDVDNCKIAEAFFGICKQHGNAFIMTRCDSWSD